MRDGTARVGKPDIRGIEKDIRDQGPSQVLVLGLCGDYELLMEINIIGKR